jgi:hypothetical protein
MLTVLRGAFAVSQGVAWALLLAAALAWTAAPAIAQTESHDEEAGHDEAGHGAEAGEGGGLYAAEIGDGAVLRFDSLNVSTAFVGGSSSLTVEELEALQGGDHDPDKTGFTLQAVDLGFKGGLDPYFDAEVALVINLDGEGETVVEIEEGFMRTQEGVLPGGLKAELGLFFTDFGLYNSVHFDDQPFVDQPVVLSRFFGADGIRGVGVHGIWRTPLPWTNMFHVAVQSPNGETMASFFTSDEAFDERPIGGRAFMEREVNSADELVYSARFWNRYDISFSSEVEFGVSGIFGPNATGGDTTILGAGLGFHMVMDGGRSLTWTTELAHRSYDAEADPANGFASDTLEDYGLYTQVLFGFMPEWTAGVRYEMATGDGESVGAFANRDEDPFRDDRTRISPLVVWEFSPTARARVQYNYDEAGHLPDGEAHSVWVGFVWAFAAGGGSHGGH